jgi:NAD(P)-dependent dehydrogenase (short-subunit alcohol dehydrogenase family)
VTKVQKSIVITGASTGIGHAAAKELVGRGYRVFGSVRKAADGERLRAELGQAFTPLLFDVTDHAALSAAVHQVAAAVGENGIAGLINNAGIAHNGPLMHVPLSEFRQVLEVNLVGVLAVTQAFLPLLGARRDCPHPPGRVINISSISGGVTFPMFATYAVSKHALEALCDGLRRELSMYGIKVSAVEPGTIKTPIWDKAPREALDARYARTDYAAVMAGLPALVEKQVESAKPVSVVTDAIVAALESRNPKTRYPLVGMWHLRKLFSDRALDRLTQKRVGLKPLR